MFIRATTVFFGGPWPIEFGILADDVYSLLNAHAMPFDGHDFSTCLLRADNDE